MRKPILVTTLIAAAQLAIAAPPSAQSIETLLEVTKVESMVDSMYASVESMMRQMMEKTIGNKSLTTEQRKSLEAMPARFVTLFKSEISWSTLKPQYIQIYKEVFEQEDIDGMITFYRSPVGQSCILKMPLAMQKSMMMAQSQMQSLIPKMQQAIEQEVQASESKN